MEEPGTHDGTDAPRAQTPASAGPESAFEPAASTPGSGHPEARPPGLRAGLARNLLGGLALLLPARVTPARFVAGFDQVCALLLLDLSVWAALDWLHAEPGSMLELDGLFGWAAYLLAGLFAAAVVARVQDRQAQTRALLVPVLSAGPYLLVLLWLLSDLAPVRTWPLVEVLVALVYLEFVGLRMLKAAYGRVRPRVALLTLALVFAAPFVLNGFGLDTRLWLADDAGQAQDDDPGAVEALLYDQPARIQAAVDRMAPAVPGEPQLFFLGFAGDGEQGVFRREALFAEQVFAAKFASSQRSLELINDDSDRDSYPLASVSGLGQATRLIASKMDPQRDVLVLMLTSHGSQDGLEVSNGSLPLAQLAPSDLHEILDDAGIRWRIIIVSACYSGVFLDELRNATTLIITAADAQHTSFGCDDRGELTWFGEAFLRDSLPGARSFEEAFAKAAALVRQREEAGHEIHSNPQFFIGEAMRQKLAGLRPGTGRPPSVPPPPPSPGIGTRTAFMRNRDVGSVRAPDAAFVRTPDAGAVRVPDAGVGRVPDAGAACTSATIATWSRKPRPPRCAPFRSRS